MYTVQVQCCSLAVVRVVRRNNAQMTALFLEWTRCKSVQCCGLAGLKLNSHPGRTAADAEWSEWCLLSFMVLYVHRNHKVYLGRAMVAEEGDYYLLLHHNNSCIKMSSDESHFNVSLIVRDKITKQCPQTTTFLNRRESRSGVEPRPFCLPA